MMAAAFRYDEPDNHVETRRGLSPAMRQNLFDLPREAWVADPRFKGEAEFWLQIHQSLLSASAKLAQWAGRFLEEEDPGRLENTAPQIEHFGHRLIYHANGHHHIEDHHFFPMFLRLFPQLRHPLELLDGDHAVLAEVLDELDGALDGLHVCSSTTGGARREAWRTGGERLHCVARRLDNLFVRHIADEEEICVPALLRL